MSMVFVSYWYKTPYTVFVWSFVSCRCIGTDRLSARKIGVMIKHKVVWVGFIFFL